MSDDPTEDKAQDLRQDINKEDEANSQGNITRQDLLDQLEAQCAFYEKLPDHQKWSPCLNVDLAYFMLLVLNILKRSQE